jgi:short-subunit dehydrogenase
MPLVLVPPGADAHLGPFTEALRQEVTKQQVRVGVLEPGGVATDWCRVTRRVTRTDW